MPLFQPTLHCRSVLDISPALLQKMQGSAILLDVDNTLTSYSSKTPLQGTIAWAKELRQAGYKVYIVSNNFKSRVSHMAAQYGLPYVSFALKPFPVGFQKACKALKLQSKDCIVIGDQIFTDILGANLGGMQSVLVDPVEVEKGFTFAVRRYFESFVRPKCALYPTEQKKGSEKL